MHTSLMFKHLEQLANTFPALMYWLDIEQKFIGMNDLCLKAAGIQSSAQQLIGKNPFEVFPADVAAVLVEQHKKVIRMKKAISLEQTIQDITTNKTKYFSSRIAPLFDEDKKIIGTIGTAIDITREKERVERLKIEKIFEHLQMIVPFIPANIYWLDLNNIFLGANEQTLEAFGLSSSKNIIGKTFYDLYPKEIAEKIVQHHNEAILTNKTLEHEESIIDLESGARKHFTTVKTPLYDDEGEIIGTIGISIDVTAQKEAEFLKLENIMHKTQLEAQEKFTKTAEQVAHDIRSPLASLLMVVKSCIEIPELERIALREAANSIGDIANDLLSKYKLKEPELIAKNQEQKSIFISAILLQILTDKKFQYKDHSIKFSYDFSQAGQFGFIRAELSSFKRMISNLINNACDALEEKEGEVTIKLDANREMVKLTIVDNGKGMSQEIIEKIKKNVPITFNKKEGHGIGLRQVHEALEYNQGKNGHIV